MRKVSLLLTLAIIPFFTFAQNDEPEINVAGIRFLDFTNNLPDDLLSTKSVVLMSLPPESKTSSLRSDWKPLAEEAHKVFCPEKFAEAQENEEELWMAWTEKETKKWRNFWQSGLKK